MRLSLAISTALLFGSYVTAVPVWPNDNGEASGSGSGNNFGALAQHDDTRFPPPNHPPRDHPPRFHPTFGYLPDPAHQLQPYQPPNHPLPDHSSLSHHNLDNLPGPPEGPPPLGKVLGDSRGGLFGLPYRCTGCGRQSPALEPAPGPSIVHPDPSTPVNRNNPNPLTRTGQGGQGSQGAANRRVPIPRVKPYARPSRYGPQAGRIPCPIDDCPRQVTGLVDDKRTLSRHLKEKHRINPNSFPCTAPRCRKTFPREYLLKNHRKATGHS